MHILPDKTFSSFMDTSSTDLISEFFIPVLTASIRYDRGVGFFSAAWLRIAAKGMAEFAQNRGRARWVISPILSEDDWKALQLGEAARHDEFLRRVLEKNLDDLEQGLEKETLSALAWLIAEGILEFKLALPHNKLEHGEFHDKFGIFTDVEGNQVSFNGSYNDSIQGIRNYESIKIFCSWQPAFADLVQADAERFEQLWNNCDPNVQVFDLPEAARTRIVRFRTHNRPYIESGWEKLKMLRDIQTPYEVLGPPHPQVPPHIKLRDYQQEAVENWIKNNGRGSFKMATGTGKTITALAIAITLHQKFNLQAMIIICPYRHLVSQWAGECKRFGFNPILAFESQGLWDSALSNALYNVSQNNQDFVCVITTNKTFSSSGIQNKIKYLPKKCLIIADEAHNLGASYLKRCLPESIRLRLALSATPERWFDERGTEELLDYFGPILEPQLTLKEAITKKALVPYRYYPILVELSEEEREEYLSISEKIAKVFHQGGDDDEENPMLTALLTRRARLVATASNKIKALSELMEKKRDAAHMLFYCGDGTVEDPVVQEEMRHVDAICRFLGHKMGIHLAPYTAETTLAEREKLQKQLDSGELQGLVAIRCLDEGVDIPSVRTAVILASSRNPRQFIQRRGRILRQAPGKTSAEIYDMIVIPPKDVITSESERRLLRNELVRFAEFADLALNGGEARLKIMEIQRTYDLMDI